MLAGKKITYDYTLHPDQNLAGIRPLPLYQNQFMPHP